MQSHLPQDRPLPDDKGLPPVTPPSGRFIAQLFLVPGLIVTVAVLFLYGWHSLFGTPSTPEVILGKLDSTNDDVRWRGASDLAQVLERKESVELRSNVKFALDLCERLRTALGELDSTEKVVADQLKALSEENQQKAWRRIDSKRNIVKFLTSALADFNVPVGAPLLCELATREDSPDIKGNVHIRRLAIFALGNMAENMKEFARLPGVQQQAVLGELHKQASVSSERSTWARTALYYLQANKEKTPQGVVLVDHALAKCARDQDREVRGYVAGVLRYWDGELVEPTLLLLARDDGHGTLAELAADE
jgi:hypothetical protein